MNNIRRLAFIGGGNMAAALIGGLTKRGQSKERIVVADPNREQLDRLVRDFGVTPAADNAASGTAPLRGPISTLTGLEATRPISL